MTALTLLAAIVTLGCAAACTRRLYLSTHSLAFHPAVWLDYIRRGEGAVVLRAIAKGSGATWEREVVAAVAEPHDDARVARVNEQLSELDFHLTRWQRVPRVCASVASSSGFLFGSLVLRYGLVAVGNGPEEGRSDAINGVVLQALSVAALGVAGTTFAIAAQYRARNAVKAIQRDADALVQLLDRA
jgi:hypothetical protein